jgi:hypothetical protein
VLETVVEDDDDDDDEERGGGGGGGARGDARAGQVKMCGSCSADNSRSVC